MSIRSHQGDLVPESVAEAEHSGVSTISWRLRWLLQDLRQMWSVPPGSGQPALRDYPLRRSSGGLR